MLASASQPGSDRGLPVAEDPFSGGRIQPFGERSQHHCDLTRGSFQAVQGGMAPSSESAMAGLTTKCLDLLSATMCAIPAQSMNVSVCDARVRALGVGTGEAIGVHPLRCSPPAFDLPPGAHTRRAHTRRDGAREATGRANQREAWLEDAFYRGAVGWSRRKRGTQ